MKVFDAIAPFYDLEHDSLSLDTTMYATLASESAGPVLVLGAGTGRVVGALAKAGLEAWGLDESPKMLEVARRKLGPEVGSRLLLEDMRNFALGRQFDWVVIPLDTFSLLLSQEDQIGTLQVCSSHLSSNGSVIIDTANPLLLPDSEQNGLRRQRFEAHDGDHRIRAWDWTQTQAADQRMIMWIEYELDASAEQRKERVRVDLRWTYRNEFEALFRVAGLELTAVWGDYSLSPYSDDSRRLIVVAKHPNRRSG